MVKRLPSATKKSTQSKFAPFLYPNVSQCSTEYYFVAILCYTDWQKLSLLFLSMAMPILPETHLSNAFFAATQNDSTCTTDRGK